MSNSSSLSSAGSLAGSSRSSRSYRIDVIIEGGKKIAIPLDPSATFSDLLEEAVKRARVLDLAIPPGKLVIHLDSKDGPLAFPDDPILEVLDFDQRPTIWLCPSDQAQHSQISGILVRWITPARALDYPTLAEIPIDSKTIPQKTTIEDLKNIAKHRTYLLQGSNEAPYNRMVKVALFLRTCGLVTTDANQTTIDDIFNGNIPAPLDIFVVPLTNAFLNAESPQDIWAFEYSKNGMATFLTCLKVFMAEIRSQNSAHRRYLKALFRIFHFPPALEAMQILKEENKLEPNAVCILATCFRELALRVTPAKIFKNSLPRTLEVSRQIFAWVESYYKATMDEVDDPEAPLVRSIFLEELKDGSPDRYEPGKRFEVVHLQGAGGAGADESQETNSPRGERLVRVSIVANCREDLGVLARALWGQYDAVENYYVDFQGVVENPNEHKRVSIMNPRDFPALLKAANQSQIFRIVGPTSLDDCYNTIITLSKDGYVSLFGVHSGEFKDQIRYFWNAASGTVNVDAHPGKAVEEALKPIIEKRKQEQTWDLDDWNYAGVEIREDLGAPQEGIVICFDLSWSMDDSLRQEWAGVGNGFTKIAEAKQVLEHVIARMLGYQLFGNFVGVVTFSESTKIKTTLEISRLKKQGFERMIQECGTGGCTALWDALIKAKDMLVAFKEKNPKTKLRIIALTDGEDNRSTTTASDACKALFDAEIVVDSIAIGVGNTNDLFRISKHTGGYAFKPTSRLLLFQIPLVEPFLDVSARPDIVRVPIHDFSKSEPKTPDMQSIFDIPQCRKNQLEDKSYTFLQDAKKFFALKRLPSLSSTVTTSTATRVSTARTWGSDTMTVASELSTVSIGRALMSEISYSINNNPDYADIFVNESDITYWKIVMDGPHGTPYEGGTFVMTMHITSTFPQFAPFARFLTPVLHPNITKNGRVCHQIFREKWHAAYHVVTVIEYMHDLLKNPEIDDAIDELASLKFWTDRATAGREIRKYVEHFAKKSREEWKREILKL